MAEFDSTFEADAFDAGVNTNADTDIIPIYIVLLPELLMLDVVGPAEVFAYANRYGKPHFKLHFVGPQTTLKNSLGMKLSVDPLPKTVEPNAWLLVTGMVGNEIKLDTPSLQKVCVWLAEQQFAKVISVCAGALVLAKSGLLKNKNAPHTLCTATSYLLYLPLSKYLKTACLCKMTMYIPVLAYQLELI